MTVTFKVDNLKKMSSSLLKFDKFLRSQAICDEDVFASKLVSCELITNVIRHCGEEATFCGELLSDFICITVTGTTPVKFDLHTEVPDAFAESGRGLYIIRCFGDIEPSADGGLRVCIKRHL